MVMDIIVEMTAGAVVIVVESVAAVVAADADSPMMWARRFDKNYSK